jgi:mannose-6-phosphate isomerase-like protein (cupin superfamily)
MDHRTGFFPAGRDRGVTVAVEGFFAFVWFGWGQAAAPSWLVAPLAVGAGGLLVAVAAGALAAGLASATVPSTVTGAGAGLCLLAFGLATLRIGGRPPADPQDPRPLPPDRESNRRGSLTIVIIREVAYMSRPVPSHHVVVVRQADAEVVGGAPVTGRLYADSSATGGVLSSQRITLQHGAAGATPHHHTGSSELFYVISGAAEMLTGERVHTVGEGDLVVVPPGTVHAFAAARDNDADLLIILAPGVERFEYFRQLQRIAAGQAPLESILQAQDLYDNHFDDSPVWQQALTARL